MKIVKKVVVFIAVSGIAAIIATSHLYAQGPPPGITPLPGMPPLQKPPDARAIATPAIETIGPGIYRMGEIIINKNSQTISFPALVNMDKGLLEYLLVRTGGKTHESLLRTHVQPVDLQLAFLLLGLEGTDRPLRLQGDPEKPRGDPVEIRLIMNRDGKDINIKPETWLTKRVDNASQGIETLDWVFTGSFIYEKRFMAQAEGSLVALYHDPVVLIDNASPGGESDKIWFVKEGTVPAVGTPVTVTIMKKNK
jgi:hypothetical protein